MKKFFLWFHNTASLKAKIMISEGVFLAIGYGFLGFYAYSLGKEIVSMAADNPGMSETELLSRFTPAFVSCIIVAVVLFVGATIICYLLTDLLTKRIRVLTRQAEAMSNDELSGIPRTEATDEIGVVTNTISIMAERLKEKVIEARDANMAKTDFLSRMSHDIRTPMNAIRGMVEIIKKNPDDRSRVDDCIKKIDISTSYLLVLIDEILDMSKLENGKFEFTNDRFDIVEIINDCYNMAYAQAGEKDISMYLNMDTLPHSKVIGCELYTRRVLTNVLNNAIKFNKDLGEVTMDVYETKSDPQHVTFEFVIVDTGVGMKQEFIEKIFDPFVQADNGARSTYSGTGLGLSVVKKILEMMDGKIAIESEVGVGSKVTFSMPFVIDTEMETEEEIRADSIREGIEGSKMLLVEDNELNMEIAKYMLENWGVEVDTAENGRIAVDKFGDSQPFTYDLILMDVRMPEMDGIEATRTIRKLARQDAKLVPIVALSANTYVEDIKAVKEAGMNDHLAKPIDVDRLFDVITKQKKLYDSKRIGHPYSQLYTGNDLK